MSTDPRRMRLDTLRGCLVGLALGDALGLPFEGLKRERVARRLGARELRQSLVFGRGMLSDDSEHAFLVALALLRSRGDADAFRKHLARGLRWWLAALPAGCGMATGKAIVRLWLGWAPTRSGVWSAGNGPAMRAPLIGVVFADDDAKLVEHVRASTLITHRDPKALHGALAVARLAAWFSQSSWHPEVEANHREVPWSMLAGEGDEEWCALIARARDALDAGWSVEAFAESLGLARGPNGYTYHSVPVAIFAALRHVSDPRAAMDAVIRCGGDTDTVAAMVGGMLGARIGPKAWPEAWRARICDLPLSLGLLERLADQLAREQAEWKPLRWAWPARPLRNLLFLAIVLTHGFARLLRLR